MTSLPLRRCRVCRTQRPKAELVRMVVADKPGRGYYACASDPHCLEVLPKTVKGKTLVMSPMV